MQTEPAFDPLGMASYVELQYSERAFAVASLARDENERTANYPAADCWVRR